MKQLCLLLALALTAATVRADELLGKVVKVQDGDTLTILVGRTQHRIRLIDIDAPELGQAFSKRSRQSLAQICAGQLARVAWKATERYQRLLGRVTCGGLDASAEQGPPRNGLGIRSLCAEGFAALSARG